MSLKLSDPKHITAKIIALRACIALIFLLLFPFPSNATGYMTLGAAASRYTAQIQIGHIQTISSKVSTYTPLAIGAGQLSITPQTLVTIYNSKGYTIVASLGPDLTQLSTPDKSSDVITYLSAATGLGVSYTGRFGIGTFAYIGTKSGTSPMPTIYAYAGILLRLP